MGKLTNKQKDNEQFRKWVTMRLVVFIILTIATSTLFVLCALLDSYVFVATGFALLVATITTTIIFSRIIKELKLRIESYCPECNTAALVRTATIKEDAGTRNDYVTPGRWVERKMARETIFFVCKNCGFKKNCSSTFTSD